MPGALHTLDQRWAMLRPHVQAFGPEAPDRPGVLLFHGCGGMRPHLPRYASAATEAGWTAFVVDSYAARGWSRPFALATVCTGMSFWGRERAGDVLAAASGLAAEGRLDPGRLALAGWSHGGWSVMDLMTMPLTRPGEAGLLDPAPGPLAGLRGVFLAYPYGGFGALSRRRRWVRTPDVHGVLCLQDHVTSPADSRRIFETARRSGARVTVEEVRASHSYDEGLTLLHIRNDDSLARENLARFRAFLDRLDGGPVPEGRGPPVGQGAPQPFHRAIGEAVQPPAGP